MFTMDDNADDLWYKASSPAIAGLLMGFALSPVEELQDYVLDIISQVRDERDKAFGKAFAYVRTMPQSEREIYEHETSRVIKNGCEDSAVFEFLKWAAATMTMSRAEEALYGHLLDAAQKIREANQPS